MLIRFDPAKYSFFGKESYFLYYYLSLTSADNFRVMECLFVTHRVLFFFLMKREKEVHDAHV